MREKDLYQNLRKLKEVKPSPEFIRRLDSELLRSLPAAHALRFLPIRVLRIAVVSSAFIAVAVPAVVLAAHFSPPKSPLYPIKTFVESITKPAPTSPIPPHRTTPSPLPNTTPAAQTIVLPSAAVKLSPSPKALPSPLPTPTLPVIEETHPSPSESSRVPLPTIGDNSPSPSESPHSSPSEDNLLESLRKQLFQ